MNQFNTAVPWAQFFPCERVRVAFVIDAIDDWQAGTEQQMGKFLRVLQQGNFEPELYFLRPSLRLAAEDFPCPVYVADWRPQVKWYRPTVLVRLVKLFRSRRPHIVQTFFRDGTYYGTLAARIAGVPVVVISVRNAGHWKSGMDHVALKVAYRLADYWQCNSRSVSETLRAQHGLSVESISVLPNAIDLEVFAPSTLSDRLAARQRLGLSADVPVFVSVANLRPVKDPATLVAAAGLVRRELPNARFLLAGEGPLRQALESQVARLNLGDSVLFLGSVADVRPYLAAADIGLLTSRSEASSNSVLEYMAMGLPVVASDIPANRDLINEVFFAWGDAKDLAAKIVELWNDPGMRKRLGEENLCRAGEYSFNAFVRQVQNYYAKLLAGRPVRRVRKSWARFPWLHLGQ